MQEHTDRATSAFQFHGRWQDFGKIAVTNLLLTIVTLGFYRFWATTRERQYLWSKTQFIDEPLEWTGRGLELLIGFLLVAVLILIPLFVMNFFFQALLLQGRPGLAFTLFFVILGFVMYLGGIARFRALRYRLSRTYWHGIRGGSDTQGFAYGWSYIWKSICGTLALGLLIPWSMMTLWNERWNEMTFGPHRFEAKGDHKTVFTRFLLFYLSPVLLFIMAFVAGILGAVTGSVTGTLLAVTISVISFYIAWGVIALAYYAKFFREAIHGLSLYKLDFNFSARTLDWFKLLLGDTALWIVAALITLLPLIALLANTGLLGDYSFPVPGEVATPSQQIAPIIAGLFLLIPFAFVGPFLRYRHWKFFINHMEAYGEVSLSELTQSTTKTSRHGEGLLDAFDVGAI